MGSRAWSVPSCRADALEPRRLLAATLPSGFVETRITEGLVSPSAMEFAPDGRLFVTEQGGVVKVVKNGQVLAQPFITVNENSQGERGLLGVTFDPNFATNRFVYLYYTAQSTPTNANPHMVLSRVVANGDQAVPGTETILFELPSVGSAIWHMGGAIHFGPDGKIYVAVGDHQIPNTAQSLSNLTGKILRLNADGSIPTDNPFFNNPAVTGQNKAIWALGLRNPFTTAFEPGTGRFYLSDVGEGTWEETNVGAPGANYGWPATEGPTFNPNFTSPLYAYTHAEGCSVIGGAFYTGVANQFPAQYQGKYFFADFCGGWVRNINPQTGAVTSFATGLSYPTGLTIAPDGSLWYLTRGQPTGGQPATGELFQVRYTLNEPPQVTGHPTSKLVSAGGPATFEVTASGTGTLSYQWQRNGANIPGATSRIYTLERATASDHGARFRAVVSNSFGSTTSNEAVLSVTADRGPAARIVTPAEGTIYAGGQTIQYSGTASDVEDGNLPASAFTWWVDLHHDEHSHPFIPPTSAVTGGQFVVPTVGETSPNVWYRIHLTVRDSLGLEHSVYRDITPRKATVTLATNIPGMHIGLDGQPKEAPHRVQGVAGLTRALSAPAVQVAGGATYEFAGWSDTGAAVHDIAFPTWDATYTALYRRVDVTYLSNLTPTNAPPPNGWGPYERDRSNGETGAADGNTITLNGVTYAKGLGVHANSDHSYNLVRNYARFASDVGVDDEVAERGSVVFQVFADGVSVFNSGTMTGSSATRTVDVNVTGVNVLRLVVTDAGNGNGSDHADWAGARLTGAGTGGAAPAAPDLAAASDTGVSSTDNRTARNNASAASALSFTVNGTTAGATVTLLADGQVIGSAVASGASTVVTSSGTAALGDGHHLLTARQTPAGGGTPSAESAGLGLAVDTAFAAGRVLSVSPDVRVGPVNAITLAFSEPVFGLETADLALTRNRGANLLTAAQTLTTSDNVTWVLGNLAPLTAAIGDYVLTVPAGAAITDTAGNATAAFSYGFFHLPGDINRDRFVNGSDFAILAGNFGRRGMRFEDGDLNGDGDVNGGDFAILAGNFGRSTPAIPAAAVATAAASPPPREARPKVVRHVSKPSPSPSGTGSGGVIRRRIVARPATSGE